MTHEEKLAEIRYNLEKARELARRYAVVSKKGMHRHSQGLEDDQKSRQKVS